VTLPLQKKAALVSKERNFDSAIFEDQLRLDYDELEPEDDSLETILAESGVVIYSNFIKFHILL
jgi:hypothetical protein